MRILFFGTSPFALPALQALHEAAPRREILGVVTQPDRPTGRGLKQRFSPVKELAVALGYPVFQPERVRRKPFPEEVAALAPDVLVVVSFGQIIPQKMLDQPRWGGINIHASLLPRWRGAAPIHHALIAGDTETGVATMQMEATLDTGPTFLVAREPIRADDTVATLEARLAARGGLLIVETLARLEAGSLTTTPQLDDGFVYAPPVTREDGLLDPTAMTAMEMDRRIRGTMPRPGAFLSVAGRTVRVWEAAVVAPADAPVAAGTVIAAQRDGVAISARDGSALLLRRLQPENRSAMAAADWARGARVAPGDPAIRPDA
jgi:methionyl-tRNA formyltransferase